MTAPWEGRFPAFLPFKKLVERLRRSEAPQKAKPSQRANMGLFARAATQGPNGSSIRKRRHRSRSMDRPGIAGRPIAGLVNELEIESAGRTALRPSASESRRTGRYGLSPRAITQSRNGSSIRKRRHPVEGWRSLWISCKIVLGVATRTSERHAGLWRGLRPMREGALGSSALMRLGGRTNLAIMAGSGVTCPERKLKGASTRLTSGLLTPGCPVRPPGNGCSKPD